MSKFLVGVVLVLALAALLVMGLNELTQAQADKANAQAAYIEAQGRARAAIIEAQGQSRLDSALAFNAVSNAALPWLIALLIAMAAAVVIAALLKPSIQPARIERIETRIVFLPEGNRRQIWQLVSDGIEQPLLKGSDAIELTRRK